MSELHSFSGLIHTRPQKETVFVEGQRAEQISYIVGSPFSKRNILYVPGLPGDTTKQFNDFVLNPGNQKTFFVDTTIKILPHSGVNPGKNGDLVAGRHDFKFVVNGGRKGHGGNIGYVGVFPSDWVDDVQISLLDHITLWPNTPIKIIAHSFGGIFTLVALSELIAQGKIEKYVGASRPSIKLVLVSSPTYDLSALPDRAPLLGSDKTADFTYYRDGLSKEKMVADDLRIPMASIYAFSHIWDFLHNTDFIKVVDDKEKFNQDFFDLFSRLEKSLVALKNFNIQIISLVSWLDRWVRKAPEYLKNKLGEKIITEKIDLPGTFNQKTTGVNAHDLVEEWLPIALKY